MQARHVCFYSNKDPWSAAFIRELKETPWIKDFRFICADEPKNRPKWLKQVPTLVIEGESEPLTDTAVMNWLYEKKLTSMPKQASGQGGPQQSAVMSGEPASWNDGEMGAFGNAGYTFIDSDTSVQGNGGNTIPGNFSFLNGAAAPGDRQSQNVVGGMSQSTGRTRKEQQFDAQMEMYKQNRDVGLPQYRRPV
jgi:hypothetical protein